MTQELRSLYEITGDIKDINTVLVQRDRLEKAEKDAARLDYMQQGVTVELLYYGPNRNFRIGGRFLAIDSDIRTAIDAAMEASK